MAVKDFRSRIKMTPMAYSDTTGIGRGQSALSQGFAGVIRSADQIRSLAIPELEAQARKSAQEDVAELKWDSRDTEGILVSPDFDMLNVQGSSVYDQNYRKVALLNYLTRTKFDIDKRLSQYAQQHWKPKKDPRTGVMMQTKPDVVGFATTSQSYINQVVASAHPSIRDDVFQHASTRASQHKEFLQKNLQSINNENARVGTEVFKKQAVTDWIAVLANGNDYDSDESEDAYEKVEEAYKLQIQLRGISNVEAELNNLVRSVTPLRIIQAFDDLTSDIDEETRLVTVSRTAKEDEFIHNVLTGDLFKQKGFEKMGHLTIKQRNAVVSSLQGLQRARNALEDSERDSVTSKFYLATFEETIGLLSDDTQTILKELRDRYAESNGYQLAETVILHNLSTSALARERADFNWDEKLHNLDVAESQSEYIVTRTIYNLVNHPTNPEYRAFGELLQKRVNNREETGETFNHIHRFISPLAKLQKNMEEAKTSEEKHSMQAIHREQVKKLYPKVYEQFISYMKDAKLADDNGKLTERGENKAASWLGMVINNHMLVRQKDNQLWQDALREIQRNKQSASKYINKQVLQKMLPRLPNLLGKVNGKEIGDEVRKAMAGIEKGDPAAKENYGDMLGVRTYLQGVLHEAAVERGMILNSGLLDLNKTDLFKMLLTTGGVDARNQGVELLQKLEKTYSNPQEMNRIVKALIATKQKDYSEALRINEKVNPLMKSWQGTGTMNGISGNGPYVELAVQRISKANPQMNLDLLNPEALAAAGVYSRMGVPQTQIEILKGVHSVYDKSRVQAAIALFNAMSMRYMKSDTHRHLKAQLPTGLYTKLERISRLGGSAETIAGSSKMLEEVAAIINEDMDSAPSRLGLLTMPGVRHDASPAVQKTQAADSWNNLWHGDMLGDGAADNIAAGSAPGGWRRWLNNVPDLPIQIGRFGPEGTYKEIAPKYDDAAPPGFEEAVKKRALILSSSAAFMGEDRKENWERLIETAVAELTAGNSKGAWGWTVVQGAQPGSMMATHHLVRNPIENWFPAMYRDQEDPIANEYGSDPLGVNWVESYALDYLKKNGKFGKGQKMGDLNFRSGFDGIYKARTLSLNFHSWNVEKNKPVYAVTILSKQDKLRYLDQYIFDKRTNQPLLIDLAEEYESRLNAHLENDALKGAADWEARIAKAKAWKLQEKKRAHELKGGDPKDFQQGQ